MPYTSHCSYYILTAPSQWMEKNVEVSKPFWICFLFSHLRNIKDPVEVETKHITPLTIIFLTPEAPACGISQFLKLETIKNIENIDNLLQEMINKVFRDSSFNYYHLSCVSSHLLCGKCPLSKIRSHVHADKDIITASCSGTLINVLYFWECLVTEWWTDTQKT